tara:strand:- start:41 stop:199 length:159 start_codon:yes stop_codon:yes gene_type:complete
MLPQKGEKCYTAKYLWKISTVAKTFAVSSIRNINGRVVILRREGRNGQYQQS